MTFVKNQYKQMSRNYYLYYIYKNMDVKIFFLVKYTHLKRIFIYTGFVFRHKCYLINFYASEELISNEVQEKQKEKLPVRKGRKKSLRFLHKLMFGILVIIQFHTFIAQLILPLMNIAVTYHSINLQHSNQLIINTNGYSRVNKTFPSSTFIGIYNEIQHNCYDY